MAYHRVLLLTCHDGGTLKFGTFIGGLDQLGEEIITRTLPYLEPPARQALDAGRELQFGPIRLNAREIMGPSGHPLAWADLESLSVRGGRLTARKTGQWRNWFAVPVTEVPNAHVVLRLAKSLRHQAAVGEYYHSEENR